jgi:hypothetical protein
MRNLRDIVESLLDDEDEIMDKAIGPVEIWLNLHQSYESWHTTMEALLSEIFSTKAKEIKIPKYNRPAIEKFRDKLNNEDYYLYIQRNTLGRLTLVATSHGLEKMYCWEGSRGKWSNVDRLAVTTPAKLCRMTRDDERLFILPKEYVWLYRRMKDDFDKNN